jgi:hypothetical protein
MTEIEFLRRWRKAYVVLDEVEHDLSAGFVASVRGSLDGLGQQARGAYAAGDKDAITRVTEALAEAEREVLGVENSFRDDYGPRPPA